MLWSDHTRRHKIEGNEVDVIGRMVQSSKFLIIVPWGHKIFLSFVYLIFIRENSLATEVF